MDNADSFMKDKKVHFDGQIRSISEAGALMIRYMIEEDLLNYPDFPQHMDPYRWLSARLNKNERTVRGWALDWSSPSGTKPTVIDLLMITHVTKSQRPLELFRDLTSDATPEQQEKNHGDLLRAMANHVRDLADTLDMLSHKRTQ
ncbi:hypothetical protein ACFL6I_01090 [candidate division KSB1 bacterium]